MTTSTRRRKDGGVEAPVSLLGLFKDDDGDDEEATTFEQIYDEQQLQVADLMLTIRQYCWHAANANKVWPGTFVLAEFINERIEMFRGRFISIHTSTSNYILKC
jgi:hypothetical protein